MSTPNIPFHHTELTGRRQMAPDADVVLRAQGDAFDGIPTLAVEEGFCEGLEDLYWMVGADCSEPIGLLRWWYLSSTPAIRNPAISLRKTG